MTEPKRITHWKAQNEGAAFEGTDAYAKDVLLIADAESGGRNAIGSAGNRPGQTESLDVESVVRKLIALLDEQQS